MLNLSDLTEFNPALVYCFEPESRMSALINGVDNYQGGLIFKFGQIKNILSGYLFIQNEILPFIREQGINAITPELFLGWIKRIHIHMAKMLVSEVNLSAGKYVSSPIFRWHYGKEMQLLFEAYFFQGITARPQLIADTLENFPTLNKEDLVKFLDIVDGLADNKSARIHKSLRNVRFFSGSPRGQLMARRLITALNDNLFTPQERQIVEKIVIVSDYPHRLPDLMRDYAAKTVAAWQRVDGTDYVALGEFCAEMFQNLTHIHPFANGQGRVATALVNIVLKSFGLNDIVIRKPGERNATEGDYANAIQQIDTNRNLFAAHLRRCIEQAQATPFKDPELEQIAIAKLELHEQALRIRALDPTFDFESLGMNDLNQFTLDRHDAISTSNSSFITNNMIILEALTAGLSVLKQIDKNTLKHVSPMQSGQQSGGVVSSNLHRATTNFGIVAVKKKMSELTGLDDWKVATGNNRCIWREFASREEAEAVLVKIHQADFCKAGIANREDNGKPVISCKQVAMAKLLAFDVLNINYLASQSLSGGPR